MTLLCSARDCMSAGRGLVCSACGKQRATQKGAAKTGSLEFVIQVHVEPTEKGLQLPCSLLKHTINGHTTTFSRPLCEEAVTNSTVAAEARLHS